MFLSTTDYIQDYQKHEHNNDDVHIYNKMQYSLKKQVIFLISW